MNSRRLDISLSWGRILVLLAFIMLSFVPASLWAGALTPVIVSKKALHSIPVASFANFSSIPGERFFQDSRGRFSWYPVEVQGLLLNSAADASEVNGTHFHPKLDKTGFSYRSRSYGLGASVGLVPLDMASPATRYEYHETGFEANVSCIYNLTSAFMLRPFREKPSGWTISMYNASGQLPNTSPGWIHTYITVGWRGHPSVATAAAYNTRVGYVAFATTIGNDTADTDTTGYGSLNYTQCRINFAARNFSVAVNNANRTISVHPLEEISWPSYAEVLLDHAVHGFEVLGLALNGHFGFSILGDTFTANIFKARPERGNTAAANLTSIGDSVSSLLDNLLAGISSAQLVMANKTIPSAATTWSEAVALGERQYIYAIFAFNLLVCSVYIMAAARTRMWHLIGNFDFLDAGNMAVAVSAGGYSIYRAMLARHTAHGTRWTADADDAIVGKTCVSLIHHDPDPAVALVAIEKDGQAERDPATDSAPHSIELGPLLVTNKTHRQSSRATDHTDSESGLGPYVQEPDCQLR